FSVRCTTGQPQPSDSRGRPEGTSCEPLWLAQEFLDEVPRQRVNCCHFFVFADRFRDGEQEISRGQWISHCGLRRKLRRSCVIQCNRVSPRNRDLSRCAARYFL